MMRPQKRAHTCDAATVRGSEKVGVTVIAVINELELDRELAFFSRIPVTLNISEKKNGATTASPHPPSHL